MRFKLTSIFLTILVLISAALFITYTNTTMATPYPRSNLTKAEYSRGDLREKDTLKRVSPKLNNTLTQQGLQLGSPVFVRIFKETKELEIWVQSTKDKKFKHFKTWKIAAMSGELGPKLAEGDMQAPEGFYFVKRSQLNPQSRFHLAFNIGYPNKYDRAHNRTGSFIMVHGNRVSIGCFAMTDPGIEEIYTLCASALKKGQPFFRVHIFPFRMDEKRMQAAKDNRWINFWQNLKEGHDYFEKNHVPPNVNVSNKKYTFR